ncbi:MAG: helix-turn-helix domain-containing protein [Anaerolineae bacterium]|nr:helix-turn-helix domain-containing protein [Anaerolineae bacterium]
MALFVRTDNDHDNHQHTIDDNRSAKGIILDDCITADTAAALSGYNIQYIRRLAYEGKLEAVRVGRAWLIKRASLQHYLRQARRMDDDRYGPRSQATLSETSILLGGNLR